MSCKICNRSLCTESFHSLEDQEAWEKRQTMSDDVDTLRRELQESESNYWAMFRQYEETRDKALELDEDVNHWRNKHSDLFMKHESAKDALREVMGILEWLRMDSYIQGYLEAESAAIGVIESATKSLCENVESTHR